MAKRLCPSIPTPDSTSEDPQVSIALPNAPAIRRPRLSRRQFLAATSALGAGAASASIPTGDLSGLVLIRLPGPGLDVKKHPVLAKLADGEWLVSPSLFGPDAILDLVSDVQAGRHRLNLRNAVFPGLKFPASFQALITLVSGVWRMTISFDACGVRQDIQLLDWMLSHPRTARVSHYEAPALAVFSKINLAYSMAFMQAAEGRANVSIGAAFHVAFSAAAGLEVAAPGLRLSASRAHLSASAVPGLEQAPALGGPFTRIAFDQIGSAGASIALCQVGSGQRASLTDISGVTLRMAAFGFGREADAVGELSGSSSGFVNAGALTVTHVGRGATASRIQLSSWTLSGRLSAFAQQRLLTATISARDPGHGVEADVCTLVIAGDAAAPIRLPIKGSRMATLSVEAWLRTAHVPVAGASAASFGFAPGTRVRISFGDSRAADPAARCDTGWHIGSEHSRFDAPLERALLSLQRTLDGFALGFGFRNYILRVDQLGAQIAQRWSYEGQCYTGAGWPRLLVHFPPQHEFEEAFEYVAKPDPNAPVLEQPPLPAGTGDDKARLPSLVPRRKLERKAGQPLMLARTKLANGSRLVFQARSKAALPRLPQWFAPTIEALTSWGDMDLVVNPRALKRDASLLDQLAVAGIEPGDSRRVALDKVRGTAVGSNDGQPGADETSIEPIYRMLVSPDASARFKAPAGAPDWRRPVMWGAELENHADVAVRVLAARGSDFAYIGPFGDFDVPAYDRDFAGALAANDVRELAGMQSVYGLAALRRLQPVTPAKGVLKAIAGLFRTNGADPADAWRDDPGGMVFMPPVTYAYLDTTPARKDTVPPGRENFPQEGIMLARPFERFKLRLGRVADVDAYWKGEPPAGRRDTKQGPFFSPAFTVERYAHRTVQGRDMFVEVVYKGFLFPLGMRAALVKVTRREFLRPDEDQCSNPIAYLVQELFIVVNRPEKSFKAYGQPFDGRDFPCASVTMLTTKTGNLGGPTPFPELVEQKDLTRPCPSKAGTVFWPKLADSGQDVVFSFLIDGKPEPAHSLLVFVDNAAAHDPDTMQQLVTAYNLLDRERQVEHHGAVRRYGAETKPGQCSFKTSQWMLGARGRTGSDGKQEYFYMDAYMEGQDQPPFYPVVDAAIMTVEPIERFTGKANVPITGAFNRNYVLNGFDPSRNASELYLDVLSPALEMNANDSGAASGGLAGAAMLVGGLSRITGPVGGSRKPAGTSPKALTRVQWLASVRAGDKETRPFDTSAAEAGRFDLKQFLDGALGKTRLFGIVLISDLVRAALIGAAPKLVETVSHSIKSAAANANEMIAQFQKQIGEALVTVQSALAFARSELDAGLAQIAPGGQKLSLADLYGSFASALDRLDASLADAAKLMDVPQPTLGQLEDMADHLSQAVRRVQDELATIARDPVPTMVKQALADLQTYWNNIREPFKLIEELVKQLLENLVQETLQALLKDACAASADILPLLFGEAPDFQDASPAACNGRIEAIVKLLRNPADALPRFEQAVLYKVFSGPLLKVLMSLTGTLKTMPLAWARTTIADAMFGVLKRGRAEIPPDIFAAPVERALSQLDRVIASMPAAPDLMLPYIEASMRVVAATLVDEAKASVLAYASSTVTQAVEDAGDKIKQHLVEEADKIITPEMRAKYEELVVKKHKWTLVLAQAKALADFLGSEKGRKELAQAVVDAVRNEFERAIAEQVEQIKRRAQQLAADAGGRLLAAARDAFDMLLNWQGMKRINDAAVEAQKVADGTLESMVKAVDALADKLFAAKAEVEARLGRMEMHLLDMKRALDGAGGAGGPSPAPQLLREVNEILLACTSARAELSQLDVMRGSWNTGKGTQGLQIVGSVVRLRGQLQTRAQDILSRLETLGRAVIAASALQATRVPPLSLAERELGAALQALHAASMIVVREGLALLGELSMAGALLRQQAPPAWGDLQRYLAALKMPVTKTFLDSLDTIKGDLAKLEQAATLPDILALSSQVKTAVSTTIRDGEARMLQTLMQAALPGGALFVQIDKATVSVCKRLGQVLFDAHDQVLGGVKKVLNFLDPADGSRGPAAAALLMLLSRTMVAQLREVETRLALDTEDCGILKGMTAASDLYKRDQTLGREGQPTGLLRLQENWNAGHSGMTLAVELVGKIVHIIGSGQLGSLFDANALKNALTEAVKSFIPSKVSLSYDFDAALNEFPAGDPIFAMDPSSYDSPREDDFLAKVKRPTPANDLVLSATVQVDLLSGERKVSSRGSIRPFSLHLLGGSMDLLTIYFPGADFHMAPGEPLRFDTQVADVKIGAMLSFLSVLNFGSGGDPNNGAYYQLRFGPAEIEVGYRYNKPLIQLGTLQLINLGFHVGARLPLEDRPAEFFASLSTRELPFLIAQPPYGGGGFFALRATASGVIAFEIQLEFGFVGALEMGPLNANARATVGIYLRSGRGHRVLEGFFHVVGSGNLGCFSVGVNMEIRTRQEDDGAMAGSATYEYSFKVGFLEVEFRVETGHRQEGGKSSEREQLTAPATLKLVAAGAARGRVAAHAKAALAAPERLLRSETTDKYRNWKKYRSYLDID